MIQLDPQQCAVVETTSPKALCLAGAGSGKTRSLIERIAHLVENCKVHPSEILAFTFTRKAAGEIMDRLEKRIGNEAFGVTMGTMHAVALNYIQRFAELIGLKRGRITVYSEWEQNFLLKEVAIELGMHTGKSWRKGLKKRDIDALFSGYYECGVWPKADAPGYDLFKAFLQRCRENNALTYGTILIEFKQLLPKIQKYLNLRHIMVDEAQDNDPLQWEIVNLIVELTGAGLFVVADIDQSIYSFRGAVPGYLVNNASSFDLYKIETNYRSTPEIVEAANALIEHNASRLPKTMVPSRLSNNDPVTIAINQDSEAIAEYVASELFSWPWENTAVIARNHALLSKISDALTEKGILHTYTGKESKLTNSEEFRRLHAFLKLSVNPYDNFAFLMVRDMLGLSVSEYSDIRYQAATEGKSHFQVWIETAPHEMQKPFSYNTLGEWINRETTPFPGNASPVKHAWDTRDSLSGIVEFIRTWIADHPSGTVEDYLQWLATYDLQDEIKEDPEGVQVMTIHASKGLEFPVVIVAGCNDGILPSKQGLKDPTEMESERRLMYVAETRAADRLILAVRPERKEDDYGKVYENPVSRFIAESGL